VLGLDLVLRAAANIGDEPDQAGVAVRQRLQRRDRGLPRPYWSRGIGLSDVQHQLMERRSPSTPKSSRPASRWSQSKKVDAACRHVLTNGAGLQAEALRAQVPLSESVHTA
jgi:hypothetical protein